MLLGITSWVGENGHTLGSGHYFRVDTAGSLQFIQGVIDNLDAN